LPITGKTTEVGCGVLAEGQVRSGSRFLTKAKGSGFVGLWVDAG
jgi:hypothetical protein